MQMFEGGKSPEKMYNFRYPVVQVFPFVCELETEVLGETRKCEKCGKLSAQSSHET